VETQHALLSITIAKAMHSQRRRDSESDQQRALDDAAAGAAGAEELLAIKNAENMVCTGVCGQERSESGWKASKISTLKQLRGCSRRRLHPQPETDEFKPRPQKKKN
jgi:hypothetical protein